jgi:rubredoxin
MKTVTVRLPDFAAMSDEEMQHHSLTGSRDGRWSSLTLWLLERFGTDKLELGDAWSQTWTGWECPVCKRPKFEIARLTDNNVLLCQLDEHHDHLCDHLKRVIGKEILAAAPGETGVIRRRAFATTFPLVERFARLLVCNDCNAADGAMKAQLGREVPSYFSFSPSEIAAFIVPAPNAPHEIEVDIGEMLWREAKPDIEQRIEFAEMMADRIMRGLHDREQDRWSIPRTNNSELFFRLAVDQSALNDRPYGLEDAIRARSISTHGKASGKTKRRKVGPPPTAKEFAALDAEKVKLSAPWRNAGADWRCEVCERSKFEILRKANSGAWTADVRQLEAYEEESDPLSRRFRYDGNEDRPVLGSERYASICQDCRQIVSDAVSLIPEADHRCMSLADIRSLVGEPLPHARHEVGKDEICALVRENGEWISAVNHFLRHRNEALDVDLVHYRLMVNERLSPAAARSAAIPLLVADGRLPPADAHQKFDWLMAERRRLVPDR